MTTVSEKLDEAIDFVRARAISKGITFEIEVSTHITEWTVSVDTLKGLLTGVLERVPDNDTVSILLDQGCYISIVFITATLKDNAIPLKGPRELIVMLEKLRDEQTLGRGKGRR